MTIAPLVDHTAARSSLRLRRQRTKHRQHLLAHTPSSLSLTHLSLNVPHRIHFTTLCVVFPNITCKWSVSENVNAVLIINIDKYSCVTNIASSF